MINNHGIDDHGEARADVVFNSGIRIDLREDEWHLGEGVGVIRRDRLRTDLAGIAWSVLADEIRGDQSKLTTVRARYDRFLMTGGVLGSQVIDLRAATLEDVQRAWLGVDPAFRSRSTYFKSSLKSLLTALIDMPDADPAIDRDELSKIVAWLVLDAKPKRRKAPQDFLSQDELARVIACCWCDIERGVELFSGTPDLLTLSTRANASTNAAPIVRWSVALGILVMAFAALRNASVAQLRIGDVMSFEADVAGLAWSHPKKGERAVVLTPASLKHLLDRYISATDAVRSALGIDRVFLVGDARGGWSWLRNREALSERLNGFVRRHGLTRDDAPLPLNPNSLRRTYVTHALRNNRSVWYVKAQLNHDDVRTTEEYGQFERYEHPAQCQSPLDGWADEVLGPWHTPQRLELLDEDARARFFGTDEASVENASPDSLLPCTTCELLHTDADARPAWESERAEHERRLRTVEQSEVDPNVLDRARNEFRAFMESYDRYMEEFGR